MRYRRKRAFGLAFSYFDFGRNKGFGGAGFAFRIRVATENLLLPVLEEKKDQSQVQRVIEITERAKGFGRTFADLGKRKEKSRKTTVNLDDRAFPVEGGREQSKMKEKKTEHGEGIKSDGFCREKQVFRAKNIRGKGKLFLHQPKQKGQQNSVDEVIGFEQERCRTDQGQEAEGDQEGERRGQREAKERKAYREERKGERGTGRSCVLGGQGT